MKTKIKTYLMPKKVIALALLAVLVALGSRGLSQAQAVSQGYQSDEQLQRGMIVRISPDDANKVEALRLENAEAMHGVVVNPNDAPATVADDNDSVFVVTTGRYNLLVSTQNGPIQSGDYITISAVAGIGMRADDLAPVVVGRALSGFDGSNATAGAEVAGHQVKIGRVPADITVARNPLLRPTEDVPELLRRVAETLAGRPVDRIRVYLGLAVFAVGTVIAATLMYSGIRSSIISIGRNPLSRRSIVRSMLQVIFVGLIIFITSLLAVYLILRL